MSYSVHRTVSNALAQLNPKQNDYNIPGNGMTEGMDNNIIHTLSEYFLDNTRDRSSTTPLF